MTKRTSTPSHSSQVAHHVSPSPLPGSEEAKKMTDISGLKCYESSEKSSPLGSYLKMCLGSSLWRSTRCLLTWKTKATPLNRILYRLAVSMPRTNENASPLWPTPSTGAALCGGTGNFKTLIAMRDAGIITEEERRQLSQGNGGKTNPGLLEWLMGYEQEFTKLIPTPTATDYKGGSSYRYWRPAKLREREREYASRVRRSSEELPGGDAVWEAWSHEPGIPRVVDGISNRMERIKCLGNAVVPQQFFPFFYYMAQIESSKA